MWNLLHKILLPPFTATVYYKEALTQAAMDVIQNLTLARRTRWEMGRNLEEMAQKGYRETPQGREMSSAYQQLSAQIGQAEQWLKGQEEKLAMELGGSNPLPSFRNFTGMAPLGVNTLGPKESDRPGIVSSGPEVANLQKFLKVVGFHLTATGEFDLQTRLVLVKFQEQNGLPADGFAGADTRRFINDILEGK